MCCVCIYVDDDEQDRKLDASSVYSLPDIATNSIPGTPTSVDCEVKRKICKFYGEQCSDAIWASIGSIDIPFHLNCVVTGIVAQEEIESPPPSLWQKPEGESKVHIWFWYFSWPIRFLLTCTIPNPRTYRNLYWLTFIVCVVYIGFITYFIFWMMVVIGMLSLQYNSIEIDNIALDVHSH